jgi:hypothetical protein
MVIIAACSSSAHQLLDLLSDRKSSLLTTACGPARLFRREAMLCRGIRTAKILSKNIRAERTSGAQRPGERLAPARKLQALQTGMQIRTPAREPGLRVGLDDVPNHHETKQAGLLRALLTAHAGTHHGHT